MFTLLIYVLHSRQRPSHRRAITPAAVPTALTNVLATALVSFGSSDEAVAHGHVAKVFLAAMGACDRGTDAAMRRQLLAVLGTEILTLIRDYYCETEAKGNTISSSSIPHIQRHLMAADLRRDFSPVLQYFDMLEWHIGGHTTATIITKTPSETKPVQPQVLWYSLHLAMWLSTRQAARPGLQKKKQTSYLRHGMEHPANSGSSRPS